MILVDTSLWVDHLRCGDERLAALLDQGRVLMHPMVLGEIACGSLADRAAILELLASLPTAIVAEHHEVMAFTERHTLFGKGIGWVDVHLLASTMLSEGAMLWTQDKRLNSAAQQLGLDCADSGAD